MAADRGLTFSYGASYCASYENEGSSSPPDLPIGTPGPPLGPALSEPRAWPDDLGACGRVVGARGYGAAGGRSVGGGRVLESKRVGKSRVVRPNLRSPYADDLSSLVIKAFGPAKVLGPLLSPVPGIEEAFVFGSWADRYSGIRGPAPADVDVLVIGRPDSEALDRVAIEAESELGREVNITIRSHEGWRRKADGLVQSAHAGTLVPIDLER